ncbi:MAG: tetratricopeptide repeat protein [Ichthyobacteriaceae bacterium]|nr:tetratricopeptide repeat protein [Ichthyobacteriaceae bacterium]
MFKRISLIVLVLSGCVNAVVAQTSEVYLNSNKQYDDAVNLYHHKQYAVAQLEFEKIEKESKATEDVIESSEYYSSLCSIKLGEKGGDYKMKSFIDNNPTSTKKNKAIIEIADYYFTTAKYAKSLVYYKMIDPYDLPKNQRNDFLFKKSYVEYVSKKYEPAKVGFSKMFGARKYGVESKYYYAHIAYLQNNNETALKYFNEVKDDKRYSSQVPFFISQIYFNQEKYSEAIDVAEPLLNNKKSKQFSDLSKLVGESYFNLEDYKSALPHLLNYKGKRKKFDNTHFYQIGYSYAKAGEYEKAISYFNKIVTGNSVLAQNAYYELASSYLKLGKKNEAQNAFRSASNMDYNEKIKEDALYNYAKLSYDVGNVAETSSQALNRYLRTYPNSLHKNEIYKLLVESYLTSNDYQEVIDVLDSTGLNSYKMKVIYQKASYFRGIQYFQDERFSDAKIYLQKSLNNGFNAEFLSKTKYWMAETEYRLGEFDNALVMFKSFSLESNSSKWNETKMLPYNMGYTNFKLKNYKESITNFELFLSGETINKDLKNDAYMRLGDVYFMDAKYWPSLDNYNKSIETGSSKADYATYQKAVCYGLIKQNDKRISTLNLLLEKYPKSNLRDDALYLLGNSYLRLNDDAKAIKSFNILEQNYSRSSYVRKAKLKKALIYYNSNKKEKALSEYRDIVEKYPSTEVAKQAVAGSRKIYIDMGNSAEYVKWVRGLDFMDITESQADSTSYLAAEQSYLKGNYAKAKPALKGYLKEYPKGISKLSAHFYLAQCEYQTGEYNDALSNYETVLQNENNEFVERSLVRSSEIYLMNKDTLPAINSFEKLLNIAEFEQNKYYAEVNLMRLYNAKGEVGKATQSAVIVSASSTVSDKIKSEAELIIARNAMQNGDEEMAKQTYAKLQITAKGEVKAEAMYYHAFFLHKDGKYEESNKVVFEVAKKYAGYKYWASKSLLIMARNFDALNDQYQAVYTLETILRNFKFEDVKAEAEVMLETIKAKTPTESVDDVNNVEVAN